MLSLQVILFELIVFVILLVIPVIIKLLMFSKEELVPRVFINRLSKRILFWLSYHIDPVGALTCGVRDKEVGSIAPVTNKLP